MPGPHDNLLIRHGVFEDMPNEGELPDGGKPAGKGGARVYMSAPQVPASTIHMAYDWVYEVPTPNPYVVEHDHPHDELLFFMGGKPDDIEDLGAVVDLYLDGEPYRIETTCAVWIPAGLKHCPIHYHSVTRPHGFISLMLHGRYVSGDYETSDAAFAQS